MNKIQRTCYSMSNLENNVEWAEFLVNQFKCLAIYFIMLSQNKPKRQDSHKKTEAAVKANPKEKKWSWITFEGADIHTPTVASLAPWFVHIIFVVEISK